MRCHIGDFNIICTNVERSLRFYRDLLEFEVLAREGVGWRLACGGHTFLLLGIAERGVQPTPFWTAQLSLDLFVEDLAEARRQFEAAGIHVAAESPTMRDRFFVRDPDGLIIEVIETLAAPNA